MKTYVVTILIVLSYSRLAAQDFPQIGLTYHTALSPASTLRMANLSASDPMLLTPQGMMEYYATGFHEVSISYRKQIGRWYVEPQLGFGRNLIGLIFDQSFTRTLISEKHVRTGLVVNNVLAGHRGNFKLLVQVGLHASFRTNAGRNQHTIQSTTIMGPGDTAFAYWNANFGQYNRTIQLMGTLGGGVMLEIANAWQLQCTAGLLHDLNRPHRLVISKDFRNTQPPERYFFNRASDFYNRKHIYVQAGLYKSINRKKHR